MSVLIDLRPGPARGNPLVEGLLSPVVVSPEPMSHLAAAPASLLAAPTVSAAAVIAGLHLPGELAVRLEIGTELDRVLAVVAPLAVRRFTIDCAADEVEDALRVDVPAQRVIYTSPRRPDCHLPQLIAAHRCSPGLPSGWPPDEVSDFLAVLAHSDVGFVARAAGTAEVLAILAATVAALRGDDIRRAHTAPDISALRALPAPAAAAVREVLLAIEVDEPGAIATDLLALGLARPER